jgi:hypothetical protein
MTRPLVTAAVLVMLSAAAVAQGSLEDVRRSHIEANVPAREDFSRLLQRDLAAFFTARDGKAVNIEYRLLREGPTLSGTAYPKYYAWVRIFDGSNLTNEGPVRLAAIERSRFEVADFISSSTIRTDPSSIERVFPAALVSGILASAGARR